MGLMDLGWRQGRLFEASDAVYEGRLQPGQYFIISHPCDLNKEPDKEPLIHLMQAHEAKLDGNKKYGKTSRYLQLEVSKDDHPVYCVQLDRNEIVTLDKQWVIEQSIEPDIVWSLASNDRLILRDWLAKRWARDELPDQLVGRLNDHKKSLKKLYKKCAPFRELCVSIDPDRETEEEYTLQIFGVYAEEDGEELSNLHTLLSNLSGFIGEIDGIAVMEPVCTSTKDLSVYRRNRLKSLNLDHLSHRSNEESD